MKVKSKLGIGAIVIVLAIGLVLYLMPAPDTLYEPLPAMSYQPPSIEPPSDLLGVVDDLLDKLNFASIAFNAPSNINIYDTSQVQLILSLAETVDEIKQSIREEGEQIGATIKVSDRMEAQLSGSMFEITSITPARQAVSGSQRTEWRWEVNPKAEGRHRLHLTLTAILEVNGQSTPRAIKTFSETIEVNVSVKQKLGAFFESNWQWLWAAILVPIGGWLWKRRKIQPSKTSS